MIAPIEPSDKDCYILSVFLLQDVRCCTAHTKIAVVIVPCSCFCPEMVYTAYTRQCCEADRLLALSKTDNARTSLLYLIILLAGSNTGYGLPSVANDITSNQYFKVFYNLFSFSIISRQITDHPLII